MIDVRHGDDSIAPVTGATFIELVANLLRRGVEQALIAESDADMRNLYGLGEPFDPSGPIEERRVEGQPPPRPTGGSVPRPAALTVRAGISDNHMAPGVPMGATVRDPHPLARVHSTVPEVIGRAGADHNYVTKPFSRVGLTALLEEVLGA